MHYIDTDAIGFESDEPRLLNGTIDLHLELEQRLARFLNELRAQSHLLRMG